MNRIYLAILALWFAGTSLFAQTDEFAEKDVFIGISSGVIFNMDTYPDNIGTNDIGVASFQNKDIKYNIGVDVSFMATKRFRPRFEMKILSMRYDVNWDKAEYGLSDSKIKLNYLDFDLRCDYLLLGLDKKFQVFVSPGIKYEVNTSENITNNWSILTTHYPSNTLGGTGSLIFKYNISKVVGFTLTPEYSYFFRPFSASNARNYSRMSYNAGFEFRF
jgi:hypothetical protein